MCFWFPLWHITYSNLIWVGVSWVQTLVGVVFPEPIQPWDPPGLKHSGCWVSFLGVKQWRHGTDHPPLYSSEVEYGYSYTSTSLSACLVHPSLVSFLRGSQDSAVSMVPTLWSGQVRNHGLIPGNSKTLLSSPLCLYRLWGPPKCLLNGYHTYQSSWVLKLIIQFHQVLNSWMSTVVPALLHMPSWHIQGQIHFQAKDNIC